MAWRNFLPIAFAGVFVISPGAFAQAPSYGMGRAPTAEEVRAWDISISPDGKELPPGHGTAKEGADLFVRKGCAGCHGATGSGGRAPTLIRSKKPVEAEKLDVAKAEAGGKAEQTNAKEAKTAAPMMDMGMGPLATPVPCLNPCVDDSNAMAIHSPFATVIWDYIHRGMPLGREGSLTPDEVYSITAFILFKNDVIHEDEVMDASSLPKVKMPNAGGFGLPPEWKHGTPRLEAYP